MQNLAKIRVGATALFLSLSFVLLIHNSFYIGVRFPNFNVSNASDLMKKGAGPTLCLVGHFIFVILGGGFMVFSGFVFQRFIYGALMEGVLFAIIIVVFYILGRKRLDYLLKSEIF